MNDEHEGPCDSVAICNFCNERLAGGTAIQDHVCAGYVADLRRTIRSFEEHNAAREAVTEAARDLAGDLDLDREAPLVAALTALDAARGKGGANCAGSGEAAPHGSSEVGQCPVCRQHVALADDDTIGVHPKGGGR